MISQLATMLTSADVNAPSQSDYRLDRQSYISNVDDKTDPSPNKYVSTHFYLIAGLKVVLGLSAKVTKSQNPSFYTLFHIAIICLSLIMDI
jgi:hypothetical protein